MEIDKVQSLVEHYKEDKCILLVIEKKVNDLIAYAAGNDPDESATVIERNNRKKALEQAQGACRILNKLASDAKMQPLLYGDMSNEEAVSKYAKKMLNDFMKKNAEKEKTVV